MKLWVPTSLHPKKGLLQPPIFGTYSAIVKILFKDGIRYNNYIKHKNLQK